VGDLRFEWDSAKARLNLRKHRVAFEEAQTVFADEHALIIDDPEHSADETRLVLLGMSVRLRILVVVHVYRMAPETIRIISARRATKAERNTYAKRLQP
jgi:uncharacterized DUF497 family protein